MSTNSGRPSAGMGLAEGAHWRCTAGLEETSKGKMHIGGRLINDVPPEGPRHRHGVPELRSETPHDRIQRTSGGETSGGFLCLGDEVQNAPGEVRFSWAPFGAGHFMRPDWIALQAETDRL